jgi:hypothetical protein
MRGRNLDRPIVSATLVDLKDYSCPAAFPRNERDTRSKQARQPGADNGTRDRCQLGYGNVVEKNEPQIIAERKTKGRGGG